MDLIAQLIGIAAMCANIISYQFRSKKTVLTCQLVGGGLFAVNMFMLDALMGGFLNVLAVLRAIAYIRAEKTGGSKKPLTWLFNILFVVSYILTFTLFQKPLTAYNLIIEALPMVGMIAMTVAFGKGDAKAIRKAGFITSPCWLVYNCINFAIGGIICEAVSLISITSAYLRLDRKTPS